MKLIFIRFLFSGTTTSSWKGGNDLPMPFWGWWSSHRGRAPARGQYGALSLAPCAPELPIVGTLVGQQAARTSARSGPRICGARAYQRASRTIDASRGGHICTAPSRGTLPVLEEGGAPAPIYVTRTPALDPACSGCALRPRRPPLSSLPA